MQTEQNKISVVINTYNAEKYLPQVLDSVAQFDEILVCDMESTDNTRGIAEKHGCRIIVFPKGEHHIVEPARNFAIHEAHFPWVLVVDADELVSSKLHDYLYDVVANPGSTTGIRIPRQNHFMTHFMHGTYPDYLLRFFRKDLCVWPSVIHAKPLVQGQIKTIPSKRKDLAFIHLADESIHDRLEKIDRYTDYEVLRRSRENYSWLAFIYRPLHRFFKSYIMKGGFCDGYPGFIYALLDAFYQVAMLSKLKEYHL